MSLLGNLIETAKDVARLPISAVVDIVDVVNGDEPEELIDNLEDIKDDLI